MKILWVVNTVFPDLARALGNNAPVVGGWMYGLARDLSNNGITLTVATSVQNVTSIHKNINGIDYYLLAGKKPSTIYDQTLENQWKTIVEEVQPKVVHIHGTEYAHGLALLNSCPQLNYVASIQGLISVCARYYLGGITFKDVLRNLTFRDIVKNDNLLDAQKKFIDRGNQIEAAYFNKIVHFIGRTQWDHDHAKLLNRNSTYHFCNESLRDGFYTSKKWDVNSKNEYSIFLSQAQYPLKGFHKLLEAVNFIKTVFPSMKIRIAGGNIIKADSIKEKLRLNGYGKYIKNLLRKYNLESTVEFTGPLNEEAMLKEYLSCHVFVCPSSIENSPNSLGEAQLLGTPCIAAYVGGVPNMIHHEKTGFMYRFEEVEMLAQMIKRLFLDNKLADEISKNSIEAATLRHNRTSNFKNLIKIYTSILTES